MNAAAPLIKIQTRPGVWNSLLCQYPLALGLVTKSLREAIDRRRRCLVITAHAEKHGLQVVFTSIDGRNEAELKCGSAVRHFISDDLSFIETVIETVLGTKIRGRR